MAFITQENKRELAPKIKEVLKKYNMKGTISVKNFSTLIVKLKSGSLALKGPKTIVATYFNSSKYTEKECQFLTELGDAMKIKGWKDNSDAMTDYFEITYYAYIKLDKSYKMIQ